MASNPAGSLLLLGFAEAQDALAERLRSMGYAAEGAGTLEEAAAIVQRADPTAAALLLRWPCPLPEPGRILRLLGERSAAPKLRFVLLGEAGHDSQRAALRAVGAGLALWEPCTQGELRFVLNHALYDARQGETRRAARVPTRMLARVEGAAGASDALVYSLSEDGAFLETPRSHRAGSSLEIELPLPSGLLHARGRVLTAKAPGSLYRSHVPEGMGVRFDALDAKARQRLERYIETRARLFQV